jgi:hypothetical protein
MTSADRRLDHVMLGAGALAVAAAVVMMRGAGSSGEDQHLVRFVGFASFTGALLLVLSAFLAHRSSRLLDAENPARRPWALLAAGLLVFAGGEASEAFYALVRSEADPFPSIADLLFLGAYPFLTLAFFLFLRVYRVLVEPDERDAAFRRVSVLLLGGTFAVTVFPVLSVGSPLLDSAISLAYVALDLVLLFPLLQLLRLTWRLRGGTVWKIWGGILVGFVLTCAADILFAWFENVPSLAGVAEQLHFTVELLFILSYLAILRGTLQQYRLLAS